MLQILRLGLKYSHYWNRGFSFERSVQNCQGTFTEGTAVSVATDCSIIGTIPFGPGLTNSLPILSMGGIGSNIVPASQLTIQASAQGIFLLGQTLTSGSSGSMSIPGPSESVIGSGSDKVYLSSISTRTAIAASVGSTLGAILILGLGFFLIRRHRKRRREMAEGKGGDAQDSSASASTPLKAQDGDGTQKPELEGSGTDVARFDKNELDANTTRLELEGVVSSEMEAPVAPQELDPVVIRHELE
ncbi:hypothetical protein F4804DRAFT_224776 [Jackrogersella minutella]|nr:hypothetical protein F4804DRAFT_224776 [Jackrogersella minutella]